MLIDEITIRVAAGHGGKGAVAFNKNVKALGPTGGSGGRGGSVIFKGVSDLSALSQFRRKKSVEAPDGKDGRGQFKDGSDGKDALVKVPVGTVITDLESGEKKEITRTGEEITIARGGRGGRGNFHFRSARNTTPKECEEGRPGEILDVKLELKLIADVGLVGLPNAGKSTLLNELTRAQSKVANYRFTTLEPHLGVRYGLILADIPGLIEGSAEGKGLGHKFLRHIERTSVLFHLVSAKSDHPEKDYETIRKELGKHNPELLKKEEYLFLSKSDEIDKSDLDKKIAALRKKNPTAAPLSVIDEASLTALKDRLKDITRGATL